MGINVWPADAVSGAPSYTGRKLRQLIGGVLTGKTSARPLGGRTGVWAGTPSTTVTISAGNWRVGPHAGALDLETANEAGPYFYSTDANPYVGTAVTAADATNPRVDIVYAQLSDPAESDGTSTPGVAFGYLAGTPAGSPTPPATPARSMVLAQLNVPNVAGGGVGSATVTWVAPYTAAAGGTVICRNSTEYPASPYTGQQVFDLALLINLVWNGAAWEGRKVQHGTFTLVWSANAASAILAVTFPVAFQGVPDITFGNASAGTTSITVNSTAGPTTTGFSARGWTGTGLNFTGSIVCSYIAIYG